MINFIKKGFTLIELLIVIAIIGILTALITTNLQGARQRARDTRRKSDLRAINQSLRLYYNDATKFPAGDTGDIKGCGTIIGPTTCSWGGTFSTTNTIYMSALPTDPSSTTGNTIEYQYYSSNDDKMIMVASLENTSDPDIADSQARCSLLYVAPVVQDATKDYVICAQ